MSKHLLVNADCRQMTELKDDSVHLVVTSPPYYNARDYSQWPTLDDYFKDLKKVFTECYRALCWGGYMCVNISPVLEDGVRINIPAQACRLLEEVGFTFREDIIWRKPDGACNVPRSGSWIQNDNRPLSYYPNIVTENIFVYKKGDYNRFAKYSYKEWDSLGSMPKDLLTNVWFFNPINATGSGHLAPFPEELPKRLISLYSFKEDTVLDPYMGSGSTGKVAKDLGRNSVGYELSPEYCELIKKRYFYQNQLTEENEFEFIKRV